MAAVKKLFKKGQVVKYKIGMGEATGTILDYVEDDKVQIQTASGKVISRYEHSLEAAPKAGTSLAAGPKRSKKVAPVAVSEPENDDDDDDLDNEDDEDSEDE
jgi:hypothetical protein